MKDPNSSDRRKYNRFPQRTLLVAIISLHGCGNTPGDSDFVTDSGILGDSGLDGDSSSLNNPPVFASETVHSMPENRATTDYVATATDIDGDILTYNLAGGADQSLFAIDSNSGALSFISAPDFESPSDAGLDNTYEVILSAKDDFGGQATLPLSIDILDEASHIAIDPLFPTSGSDVGRGYLTTTTVMCKIHDLEGPSIVVASASVNGVALSETSVGSGIWFVQIDANAGQNTLLFSANVQGRTETPSTEIVFNNNGAMRAPRGLVVDSGNNKIYVSDSAHDSILSIDLNTGLREVISDLQRGTGELLFWPRQLEFSGSGDSVLVVDRWNRKLYSIDLATGNRLPLSGTVGSPQGLALSSDNSQALVAGTVYTSIFGVDLTTGTSSVIASDTVGLGDPLGRPFDIEADSTRSQYVVASQRPDVLFALNPESGDRSVIASDSVGSGPAFSNLSTIAWQANDSALWVGDDLGVLDVDMATGNRDRILSTTKSVADVEPDLDNNRLLLVSGSHFRFDITPAITALDLAKFNHYVVNDASIGTGPHFTYPRSTLYAPSGQYVYVGDSRDVFRVSLANGDREVVSGQDVGLGPLIRDVYDMEIDEPNQQLIALTLGGLFQIDLLSGDRTVIADSTIGTGPDFGKTSAMAVDWATQKAWLVDYELEAVIEVDLGTGDRTILSDNVSEGVGQDFEFPFSIVLDTAGARLLVGEGDGTRIVTVNLSTGDRVVLSDVNNSGPAMKGIRVMEIDPIRNRLLVMSTDSAFVHSLQWMIEVDLTTGNRRMISSPGSGNVGSGPIYRNVESISVDAEHHRVFTLGSGDGTIGLVNVSMETGDRVIVSH